MVWRRSVQQKAAPSRQLTGHYLRSDTWRSNSRTQRRLKDRRKVKSHYLQKKKLSSQIKTQEAVESVQNSEVQEDAGQLKKAVGDRVEFTSKLKTV